MRQWLMLILGLMVPTVGGGCGLLHTGTTVVAHKTREALQEHAEQKRNRSWARQAWHEVVQLCGPGAYSCDHADGFKEGFAEYLYRGGNGEPPPLPPFRYRALRYQTPEGYRAVQDWFAGYRHGAALARQGGYRDLITGPSSLRTGAPPALSVSQPDHVPALEPPLTATSRSEQQVKPAGWGFTITIKPPWE